MNNLFRPSILIVLSAALAIAAAILVLRTGTADNQPRPMPVPANAREIVWLYSATDSASWERFVTAARTAVARLNNHRPELGLVAHHDNAYPPESTAVPELTISGLGGQRLLFRWYKLTSSGKPEQWIHALSTDRSPPLAIIGGDSSGIAIELANVMQTQASARPGLAGPLLILTQATADETSPRDRPAVGLTEVYPGRTFRFCFTNRQMARAVSEFIRSQERLRPDPEAVFLAYWKDDLYSLDMTERLCDALRRPAEARTAAREWGWQAGFGLGTSGFPLDLAGLYSRQTGFPVWEPISSGVGTFDQPNRWEADAARNLVEKLGPEQSGRPPLVLPAGAAQPARRFLRGLFRAAPTKARRFIVLTGDGISFNTVYRDRNVAWPIQDLPFDLVFFCHRNPVEGGAGFTPETEPAEGEAASVLNTTSTEDLLRFVDIVEATVQAALASSSLPATGDELGEKLRQAHWLPEEADGRIVFGETGIPLFSGRGNRLSGTGEHVVWLEPQSRGERLLPRATVSVWAWQRQPDGSRSWKQGRELRVEYDLPNDD